MKQKINFLTDKIINLSIEEQFQFLIQEFPGAIKFSTSFGQEDQAIIHYIFNNNFDVKVFTLDTGRLFNETYKTFEETLQKYGKKIQVYYPDYHYVENLMTNKGPFNFYNSIEDRKECCNIRKVIPLKKALKNCKCWVTGLRASQSSARSDLNILEYDENFQLIKYNPLYNWSLNTVLNFIKKHNIPYNILHDRGFISIGCEPCTRAIREGEDIRKGRWWWEDSGSKKECGLHSK